MASDPEPRRVEVELTPTGTGTTRTPRPSDQGREDRDGQPGAGADHDSGVSVRSSLDVESIGVPQRTVIVGAVAAILGLAGGWLLGSGAGSGSRATDDSDVASATAPVTDDTFDPDRSTLEPIDSVQPTTTARPRRTATTITLPGPQVAPVGLHPVLAGHEFRLVGVTGSNTTAELDVDAGTMTTRNWGSVSMEPTATLIGEGWVVAPSPNTGSVTLVTGDGDRSNPPIGEAWSLLAIEGGDRFWRPVDLSFGPFVEFEEVDRSGEPTGPRIDTAGAWPAGVDPAGGILTVVQGNTYSLRPDRTELVGEGDMVAVSETHAVVSRCDATLMCALVLVDRATAEERTIPGSAESRSVAPFGFFPLGNTVSPDGAVLAQVGWTDGGRPTLSVVDIESGSRQVLSERSESGLAWSPDGRFGFFVDGSTLMFYDRVTGEIDDVGDDIGTWRSVDVLTSTG